MDWASSLPDAYDQLVLIARQAPELAGTTVRDGPAVEDQSKLNVLYIGWTGGTSDTDGEATVSGEGLVGNPDQEQAVIRCTGWVLDGSTDIPTVRRAAYAIMSGLGAAIAANRTLNSTVMRAWIGDHTLTQQQTTGGAQVAITFEVNTLAFTRR